MLQKILVPLDGSQLGELALPYAIGITAALRTELNLVTVSENREKENERAISIYLDKIADQLGNTLHKGNDYPKIRVTIIHGRPADALVRYAIKYGTDLIIMVSHGRSGIMPWSAGSTATRVIQKSQIPVLLIRAKDNNRTNIENNQFARILLPLDGSSFGEAAIPLVKDLALAFHSEVYLFRVVERIEHVYTIGGIDHFMFSDEQTKRTEAEVGIYLTQISEQFTALGIKNRSISKTGDPAVEILKISKNENISLVAMSSHGKNGITRWVLGSVSHKILQAGGNPLLLVRPLYKNVT